MMQTQTETESRSQEATAIIGAITALAQIVEGSVDRVIEALLARDAKLTDGIFTIEPRINELEMRIDELAVAALCGNNLAVEDVRLMVASLKISNDLERMGDLAINIGQRVIALSAQAGVENPPELQPMAIAVSHMCRKVLRALIYRDLALAMDVLESDDLVDSFRDHVYQSLRERMRHQPGEVVQDLELLLASRHLERIADHATNIAEDVIYWVRGVDVRHGRAPQVLSSSGEARPTPERPA